MTEDRTFEDWGRMGNKEGMDINMARSGMHRFKSYKDTLKANPVEVMAEFLGDFYSKKEMKNILVLEKRK